MGVIGRRLADAIGLQPDLVLAGIAVRSAGLGVIARPGLPYFASGAGAGEALRKAGIEPAGNLADLIAAADLIIDAGPARSGAGRYRLYQDGGVLSVFSGGERDTALGPLVHPALNYHLAVGRPSIRLPSCNTTALGRLIAAIGPADVADLRAILIRCGTDTDKARKGSTNGTIFDIGLSHHGADLESVTTGIRVRVRGAYVPAVCGHVALAEVTLRRPVAAAMADQLSQASRIVMLPPGQPQSTARLKAEMYRLRPRGDRYELAVQLAADDPATVTAWLSIDNEAITIPEAMDVIRALSGVSDGERARAITDRTLLRTSQDPPK